MSMSPNPDKSTEINTDNQLVDEVKAGNKASYSELVKRHQKGLLRLSVRFVKDMDTAKDVVQESFIKGYEKLSHFEGRASFKSWIYQITVNTAKNKLREFRHDTCDINHVHLVVKPAAESTLVRGVVSDIIHAEVEKLPFKQRTALILRVYEDLSFQEIADVMECPYDTAKANYRHALLKLKSTFESQEELSALKNWSNEFDGLFSEIGNLVEVEG